MEGDHVGCSLGRVVDGETEGDVLGDCVGKVVG